MKMDRLIGIISILLQNEKVTAPYLAQKFEVSRRTINRDIESICNSGIPLVTEQGQNGGISIMSGYKIDRTALTSSEMNAILTGLQSLDSVSGSKQYQQLMEKLSCGTSKAIPQNGDSTIITGTGVYINLASYYKTLLSPKIELFKKAIYDHKRVSFSYYSPKGISQRKIEPYTLIFNWSSWYVWAYCCLRDDFRLFKLNRMTDVVCTNDIFDFKNEIPSPEIVLKKGSFMSQTVKVLFSQKVKWRVIDEFGSDFISEENSDDILLEFPIADNDNLFSLLLSYGTDAKIIEPIDLRNLFLEYIKEIEKLYSEE